MTCGIIGDSIALGLALINSCDHKAFKGASSVAISKMQLKKSYDRVVISAGSNDLRTSKKSLHSIRAKVKAKKVIWVLPMRNTYTVKQVAARFGDSTVSFRPSKDGIHPANYRKLNASISRL